MQIANSSKILVNVSRCFSKHPISQSSFRWMSIFLPLKQLKCFFFFLPEFFFYFFCLNQFRIFGTNRLGIEFSNLGRKTRRLEFFSGGAFGKCRKMKMVEKYESEIVWQRSSLVILISSQCGLVFNCCKNCR